MKPLYRALLNRSRQHSPLLKGSMVLVKVVAIVALLFSSTVQVAFSQNKQPALPASPTAWTVFTVDAPPTFLNMTDRSMRLNANGYPCVAYGGDRLYYSCYNPVTEAWSVQIVDPNLRVGEYAALAFDQDFNPFIVYYDAWNGRLKMAYNWFGGGWTKMVLDFYPLTGAEAETPPVETSLQSPLPIPPPVIPEKTISASALDTSSVGIETPPIEEQLKNLGTGLPWQGDLYSYGREEMSPSLQPTVVGVGKYPSIDFDGNNRLHVSYYDEVIGALKYIMWDGITWDYDTVHDYTSGDTGLWTSLVAEKTPPYSIHVSFMSDKYDYLMYAAKRDDGAWYVKEVDKAGNVGAFTSIALDSDERPYISYLQFSSGDYALKFAKRLSDDLSVWGIKIVDSGDAGLYTSIALDSNDKIFISYYDADGGDLKYASSGSGDSWSVKAIKLEGDTGYFTSIDIDDDDQPVVTFFNATEGLYQCMMYDAVEKEWVLLEDINYSADVGLATSLAMNSEGTPFITYMDDSKDYLKYARAYGPTWMTSYVTKAYNAGGFSSIELIGDFTPAVALYNYNKADLVYATQLGGLWRFENVDSVGNQGMFPSLAMSTDYVPHMSYYDADTQDLMYAYWKVSTSSWVTKTIDYWLGDQGVFSSIALDTANRPSISYYDAYNNYLKRAFLSPLNAWVFEVPDSNPGVGLFSSMVIDSADRPHIVYYDMVNHRLKYATKDAGNWFRYVIDDLPGGIVGMYCSLAIDKSVMPNILHVSYYDATNGDLLYMVNSGAGWSPPVIVDSIGDVGLFSSIALDALGRPGISYYDATRGDLKYASSFAPLPFGKTFIPLLISP